MKVSSSWLKEFGSHVQNLLNEFQHVPEAQKAGIRIEKVLVSVLCHLQLDNYYYAL